MRSKVHVGAWGGHEYGPGTGKIGRRFAQTLHPCCTRVPAAEPGRGVRPSPTASPHTALLTCEAEAQHSQGGGHTHTRARAAHLPLRQLTAGFSAAKGCPACEERK